MFTKFKLHRIKSNIYIYIPSSYALSKLPLDKVFYMILSDNTFVILQGVFFFIYLEEYQINPPLLLSNQSHNFTSLEFFSSIRTVLFVPNVCTMSG